MSKKVECKFCKLGLMYMKDHIVVLFGYKNRTMVRCRVTLCRRQGPIVKASFSRCGGLWPTILNDVLVEYGKDMGDDVVGSHQQASCDALSNVNRSQIASSSHIVMARDILT